MTIQYYGMLSLPHSWSCVSQNLILEMQKKGLKFICKSTNNTGNIPKEIETLPIDYPVKTDISLSYTIPPNLLKIDSKHMAVICNPDNTKLPPGWAKILNEKAHLILPSSNFARDTLKENGVNENKMIVVPHGYNPLEFHPDVPIVGLNDSTLDQKFRFLSVSAPHWRKGFDVLLSAYLEEFKIDQDVVLIIKTSPNSSETSGQPFHVDFNKLIAKLKKNYPYRWPELRFVTTRVENLGSLYRWAHVNVLATRAECFSLTMLEGAMVKCPSITTEYGGHLDFLNKDNSYLIDYTMKKCPKEGQYYQNAPDSYVGEPDKEHLKQLMRHVKNNYPEAQLKAEKCYQDNKHLTWENAGQQIIDLINQRGWKV